MSKKQIKFWGIVASVMALIVVATGVSVKAETGIDSATSFDAGANELTFGTELATNKSETVYLMTDANGAVKSTFVGSTLYDGNAELPFEVEVLYYLDGEKISASELAHKTGHVKMVYRYLATKFYQGKRIPFVAMTAVTLDGAKFSNVKITNGKMLSEGDNYMIAGYSLVGMNEDLGTDFLPDSFSMEADVRDFALDNVYTVLMNDLIADIDTSKLSSVDALVSAMNQLADGVSELTVGAGNLSDGLAKLVDGTKELNNSSKALAEGISSATSGAEQLVDGLDAIVANNAALQSGAEGIIESTLASLNSNATVRYVIYQMGVETVTVENYKTVITTILQMQESAELSQAMGLLDFATGVIAYTDGVSTVAAGADALETGLQTMDSKMPALVEGASTLASGAETLYNGSLQLGDGVKTLKSQGIDKLVTFANNDLTGFTKNARLTVAAAGSYRNFASLKAETVKFVVKMQSIK